MRLIVENKTQDAYLKIQEEFVAIGLVLCCNCLQPIFKGESHSISSVVGGWAPHHIDGFCPTPVKVKCPIIIEAKNLQLRDIIQSFSNPYCSSTVVKIDIENKMVHLVRPFIKCEDFSFTGGVLHYTGVENHVIRFNTEVTLIERPNDRSPLR